jgi:hypothetical protein
MNVQHPGDEAAIVDALTRIKHWCNQAANHTRKYTHGSLDPKTFLCPPIAVVEAQQIAEPPPEKAKTDIELDAEDAAATAAALRALAAPVAPKAKAKGKAKAKAKGAAKGAAKARPCDDRQKRRRRSASDSGASANHTGSSDNDSNSCLASSSSGSAMSSDPATSDVMKALDGLSSESD